MKYYFLTTFLVLVGIHCFSQKKSLAGKYTIGDFNGDNKIDTAFVKQVTSSKTANRIVFFSDKNIPSLNLGCCDVYVVSEGDLNKNKTIELSIFQAPENGCTYMWTTYTYKAGKWNTLIPTFLVPTYCEPFKPEQLQKKVFSEKGKVYYWDIDPNDEERKQLKKEVIIN